MTEQSLEQLDSRVSSLEAKVEELRVAAGLVEGQVEQAEEVEPAEESMSQVEEYSDVLIEEPEIVTPPSTDNSIEEWFASQGLTVKLEPEKRQDRVYDKLAEYLGDNFSDIEKFLSGLRWTLAEDKITRQALRKLSEPERKHTLEFAEMLNNLALLDHHNYNASNQMLSFKVKASADSSFKRFLGGLWLERYALAVSRRKLDAIGQSFSIARNLFVSGGKLHTGVELDVFLLAGDEPIWIECKIRDHQDVSKYAERADELGVPRERTVLVVHTINSDVARDLGDMYEICVTPTSLLGQCLQRFFTGDVEAEDLSEDREDQLASVLRNAQMSPNPQARRRVLQALLDAALKDLPATVGEVRERMLEAVPTDIQPAVHPVLMAVRRGGGLLMEDDTPYTSMALEQEVARLAAEDVLALEEICQAAYREAIERKLPGALDKPEAMAALERLVGALEGEASTV